MDFDVFFCEELNARNDSTSKPKGDSKISEKLNPNRENYQV